MRYVLPGLTVTSKMYEASWRQLPETRFIDWPTDGDFDSMASLARRMIDVHDIQGHDAIVGTSFGGMVGLEIARLLNSRDVTLISSALSPSEIYAIYLWWAARARWVPVRSVLRMTGVASSRLRPMVQGVDAGYVRSACRALLQWRPDVAAHPPVRRIHGRRDRVIRCPADADRFIDGGHLIALTRAAECAAFVDGRG